MKWSGGGVGGVGGGGGGGTENEMEHVVIIRAGNKRVALMQTNGRHPFNDNNSVHVFHIAFIGNYSGSQWMHQRVLDLFR